MDYTTRSGRDRIMARGIFVKTSEPDFIWNSYKDFITPLIQDTWAVGGSYTHTFSASVTNEFRLSRSDDGLHFNRPHPEIPTLLAAAPSNYYPLSTIALPASPQFYSYLNLSKSTEFLDNVMWSRGRHLITIGAGFLFRNVSVYLTAGRDGEYTFDSFFRPGAESAQFWDRAEHNDIDPDIPEYPGSRRGRSAPSPLDPDS